LPDAQIGWQSNPRVTGRSNTALIVPANAPEGSAVLGGGSRCVVDRWGKASGAVVVGERKANYECLRGERYGMSPSDVR